MDVLVDPNKGFPNLTSGSREARVVQHLLPRPAVPELLTLPKVRGLKNIIIIISPSYPSRLASGLTAFSDGAAMKKEERKNFEESKNTTPSKIFETPGILPAVSPAQQLLTSIQDTSLLM